MVSSGQAAAALIAITVAVGCFVSVSSLFPMEAPAMGVELETNATNDQFPFSHPPDYPIEYTYGLKGDLGEVAAEWEMSSGTPLLQPTWLPEGMSRTSIYVQRANVTAHTGVMTQVTTLYSHTGIDHPFTAEIQLRVQMKWNTFWMTPSNLAKTVLRGNYTEINGYPAYNGLIGWFEGDYYLLYGGWARVVSVQIGDVLYFFRAPEDFPSADLVRIASSLQPIK
jgi:hypothetical protein